MSEINQYKMYTVSLHLFCMLYIMCPFRVQLDKVQYIDTSKAVNLKDINAGLKKATRDIENLTRKGSFCFAVFLFYGSSTTLIMLIVISASTPALVF